MKCIAFLLSMLISLAGVGSETARHPIAVDYHLDGPLFVLSSEGEVSQIGDTGSESLLMTTEAYGFRPVDIVSARLGEQNYVFVSGFIGREGIIFQYTSSGVFVARFSSPQLAAGFDVDTGSQSPLHESLMYVASPVANAVFALDIANPSKSPRTIASIKEAVSLGPLIFDRQLNKLFVGDQGNGKLYEINLSDGHHSTVATDLGTPVALALSEDDATLYVADSAGGRIIKVAAVGHERRTTRTIPTTKGAFVRLSGLAAGPRGTLYLADFQKGIFQITMDGSIHAPGQVPAQTKQPTLACATDLRVDLRRPLKIENSDIGLYLYGISTSDKLTIYVFRSSKLGWGTNVTKVSRDRFKTFLADLTLAKDNSLEEDSYVRLTLKKQDLIALTTESGTFRAKVTESHYFKDYAVLQICK